MPIAILLASHFSHVDIILLWYSSFEVLHSISRLIKTLSCNNLTWNQFPPEVTPAVTIEGFKMILKKHLFGGLEVHWWTCYPKDCLTFIHSTWSPSHNFIAMQIFLKCFYMEFVRGYYCVHIFTVIKCFFLQVQAGLQGSLQCKKVTMHCV